MKTSRGKTSFVGVNTREIRTTGGVDTSSTPYRPVNIEEFVGGWGIQRRTRSQVLDPGHGGARKMDGNKTAVKGSNVIFETDLA
jgi:hypothetical protein